VLGLLSGFVLPDAGRVLFEGRDVSDLSPDDRARQGLVRRFQDALLFPSLTVSETLAVALERSIEVRSPIAQALRLPSARISEAKVARRVENLVELFELGAFRDKFVGELSTGTRRVLDLACVLAVEPRVLLLDEPSSGLAQRETEAMGPLIRRIRYETGASIAIVEHDMPLISSVSDELLAMDLGQTVLRGTPDEVLNDERVVAAYLGSSEEAIARSGRVR
jgi:branched-chain amino acid transport system ATP-binding protein